MDFLSARDVYFFRLKFECVNCECTQNYTDTLDAYFIYLHKYVVCNLATAAAAVETTRTY